MNLIINLLLFPFKFSIRTFLFFLDRVEFYFKNCFRLKVNVLVPPLSSSVESNAKVIAIFAIYQPKGLSFLIKRSINYLVSNGVKLILVVPHRLNEEEINYLKNNKCIVLTRRNIGRDFGSYKYGIKYLYNNLDLFKSFENILLINDSIIFPLKEEDNNLKKIFFYRQSKVVGLIENYQFHWHICSYFILFRKDFFLQESFKNFWKKYKPYNSRLHAINRGEVLLSKVINQLTDDCVIIYSGEKLLNKLKNRDISMNLINKEYVDYNIVNHTSANESLFKYISKLIENSSPVHSLGLILIEHLDCFFIKKDICYRDCYPISYVIHYIAALNNNLEFLTSLLYEFKNKKLFVSLSKFKKLLYFTGAI